ncbi:MAG: endonuclease/exonuclease/phosphatase family protein [Nocardioidaceae bacterium]
MKIRWLLLGLVLTALLGPAVALTFDRVAQPSGGAWVRLVSFTPYAVALYGLALLVLLLVWLRSRGGWRVLARLLVVVAALGLVMHLWWAHGPYVGPAAAATEGTHRVTVMTANLMLGQASPSEVVATAVRDDVDVLVLEEVTPQVLGGMQAAGLSQAFPHAAGQAADGARGTMVFSTRKLSDIARVPTGFGSYRMRVARPGGSFTLFAVHTRPPAGDATGWVNDHRAILSAAEGVRGAAVIAGDFNATPDHRQLQLLAGHGYTDAATEARAGWQPTWPSDGEVSLAGFPVPTLLPLDHVLTNPGARALRTDVVSIDGTDHRVLVARLEM